MGRLEACRRRLACENHDLLTGRGIMTCCCCDEGHDLLPHDSSPSSRPPPLSLPPLLLPPPSTTSPHPHIPLLPPLHPPPLHPPPASPKPQPLDPRCLRGWEESTLAPPPSCSNVNECASGTSACHTHAECTDTIGSYVCTCLEGYEGGGGGCVAVCGDARLMPEEQ